MDRQKTALITGGARGIGQAITRTLAREGYHVLINYFRSEKEARELAAGLDCQGCQATLLRADVVNPKDVREMVAKALLETGRIDVLVNNAGMASWGLLTETPEETWDRVLATNLKSGYLLSHAVLPNMIQNKSGSIVNVSSMWGVLGASCEAAYSASKAGLIGLTRSLAQEVAPSGIRVNAVSPGVIQTDMISGMGEEDLQALVDRTPLNRIGLAQEVAEAVAFLHALRQLLVYADVGECNLEMGNMRCDANISLRPAGQKELGTKTEIKNLNTFKGVQAALEYEIDRQAGVLASGGHIVQETRRWDSETGVTEAMRGKEDAVDYRYFPDPDLLPVVITPEQLGEWRAMLPERPAARRRRMMEEYGIPEYDAGVLAAERPIADFFEAVARACGNGKAASNWIMTEVLRLLSDSGKTIGTCALTPEALAELITLVGKGTINQPTAKALLDEIFEQGGDVKELVAARGLAQVGDRGAIADWVRQVLEANPGPVADFKAGKKAAATFLMGQVMKLSRGKADPRLANEEVARQLAESGA